MSGEHSALWNSLPDAERERLHPFLIETHILHLEQTRSQIVASHTALLADLNGQIANLRTSLNTEVRKQAAARRAAYLKTHAEEFSKTMQCNCDLDNWVPEPTTGHSWVCRIHKAAIGEQAR